MPTFKLRGKALLVSPQRARWLRNLALMFDRVTIRVLDLEASERFYRGTLSELGIEPTHTGGDSVQWADFSIVAADAEHPPTRHLHVAFVAATRDHVDRFLARRR